MLPPAALTLDLDETLLDLGGLGNAIEATCRAVAAAIGTTSMEKIRVANALVWESYWPQVEMEWTLGRVSGADLTRQVWRLTLEACRVDDSELVEMATASYLETYRSSLRLYDDALALLDAAASVPVRTALITNGAGDTQRDKLRAVGIDGMFDAVVISGELGVAKPDPGPFQVALEKLGTYGRSVWHIGDSLTSDVAGANAAGLTSVWLNRGGHLRPPGTPNPDMQIRSLTEVTEALGQG